MTNPSSPRTLHAADSPDAAQRITDGLPLVQSIARGLHRQLGGRILHDDLVGYGHEGLITAARSFDPSRGVPFAKWASYRVRGAMIDGVRGTSMLPRAVYERLRAVEGALRATEGLADEEPAGKPGTREEADERLGAYLANIATAVAMGLLATPADGVRGDAVAAEEAADEQLARSETLKAVREAVRELPEQERHIIQRHYFEDVQLDQAASEIGLSKSWGSRLHTRAIASITKRMKRAEPPA